MIGFDPKAGRDLTPGNHMVAGAVSTAITRGACQPLDLLKIRFQLQMSSAALENVKYRSLYGAVKTIMAEEGVTAFWKGHLPAQYLSFTYGMCRFGAFESLTKRLYDIVPWSTESAYRPMTHFVIGGLAGVLGTLLSYPFDVIRTRLVAQGQHKIYQGTVHAGKQMMLHEGYSAFFKGIIPTFATIAPYSGLQFGFYSLFTQTLGPLITSNSVEEGKQISMVGSLSCGALAGLCAMTLAFPFDTTKKRLQVQGFEQGRRGMGRTEVYSGMVDCFVKTVRHEGWQGLFKGLSPGLLKAVVTTSINFWLYEYVCHMIAFTNRNEESGR